MNRVYIFLLLGLLSLVFLIPFSVPSGNFERVRVINAGSYVVLEGSSGSLEVRVSGDVLGEGEENVYNLFSRLIDSSQIQRLEIVRTPEGLMCRILTSSGRAYAGKPEFCIALALRVNIPVYVEKEILKKERSISWGF